VYSVTILTENQGRNEFVGLKSENVSLNVIGTYFWSFYLAWPYGSLIRPMQRGDAASLHDDSRRTTAGDKIP